MSSANRRPFCLGLNVLNTKYLSLMIYEYPLQYLNVRTVQIVNTLWPSDATRLDKTKLTLFPEIICYLGAPNNYPTHCWLIVRMAIAIEMLMNTITKKHLKLHIKN